MITPAPESLGSSLTFSRKAWHLEVEGWKARSLLRSFTVAVPHAKSGEVIDIRPLGSALAQARTTTLVKTKTLGNHPSGDSIGKRHP